MKTFPLRPALLAIALLGAPAALIAAPGKGPLVAFSSARETISEPLFGRGMPASQVLQRLGEPDVRLAPGLWVYWHYHTNRAELNAQGLDTLVIALSHDRVTGLKIVPRQSLEPLIARLPALAAARTFAATRP